MSQRQVNKGEIVNELTERGKVFRAAIAAFVGMKLKKLPRDENGNFSAADAEECAGWLAGAINNVPKLYTATHVLKATHPKASGSDVHAPLRGSSARGEIGTHTVSDFDEDIIASTAAYLGASSFLRAEFEGRRVLDWVRQHNEDFCAALHPDSDTANTWMQVLQGLTSKSDMASTHPMAKQVYWLIGEDPLDNTQYQLLQPMFSSTLAHAVHANIQDARFGKANKEARQAFRDKKPFDATYRDYRNLVARKLGGTKPQNISQLNSERGGINYLLASLPPPAWQPSGLNLLKQESAFEGLIWFGGMRELVRVLSDFLDGDPDPTMETRQHREVLEQAIAQEMAMFGAAVRGQYAAGWTRDTQCQLPRRQQLWLDPDRITLPLRDDPQQRADDEDFNTAYELGIWADEVAADFGDWLNARLHATGLLEVSHPERRHWAGEAIIDVAWPVPVERRVAGGVG